MLAVHLGCASSGDWLGRKRRGRHQAVRWHSSCLCFTESWEDTPQVIPRAVLLAQDLSTWTLRRNHALDSLLRKKGERAYLPGCLVSPCFTLREANSLALWFASFSLPGFPGR